MPASRAYSSTSGGAVCPGATCNSDIDYTRPQILGLRWSPWGVDSFREQIYIMSKNMGVYISGKIVRGAFNHSIYKQRCKLQLIV